MMLVAYIATMSAQEQTEAPVVTCEFDEIGYATIIIPMMILRLRFITVFVIVALILMTIGQIG